MTDCGVAEKNSQTNEKPFPPILAKTWLDLLSHTEDDLLRDEVITRLTNQFGSIMKASNYVDEYFGKK